PPQRCRLASKSRSVLPHKHRATTQTTTLSLHDALPILIRVNASHGSSELRAAWIAAVRRAADAAGSTVAVLVYLQGPRIREDRQDRKSTRLNSSHVSISYAVFCLKKKNIVEGCSCLTCR